MRPCPTLLLAFLACLLPFAFGLAAVACTAEERAIAAPAAELGAVVCHVVEESKPSALVAFLCRALDSVSDALSPAAHPRLAKRPGSGLGPAPTSYRALVPREDVASFCRVHTCLPPEQPPTGDPPE